MHRQVEQRLIDNEIRYTRGRQAVVESLDAADGPRSAAELSPDLPSVPLSSLYRTLAVLEEAGVVVPHLSKKGIARYELAEWLAGHHHHLVCVECGRVEDVDVPDQYEAQVHELVGAISSQASFVATNHALEIEGRCERCL
ncbi:MAG: Fur family transcriptional regulator [Acidimicrobiia bacterium]